MTERVHMNFDEAIALFHVGASGFTFKNQAGETFKAVQEMVNNCPLLLIQHQPKEETQ